MSKLLILLLWVMTTAVQDTPKLELSNEPLTAEQIAVYRAVLEYTQGPEEHSLNIANVTDPFYLPGFNGSCPKDDEEEPALPTHLIIHRLAPSIAVNNKIVLVDPNEQNKIIEKNDGEKMILSARPEGHQKTETDINGSVETAFSTGMVSLSEIVFNKKHTRAILTLSFCARRKCGAGSLMILKRVRNRWKVGKTCAFWIS